MLTLPELDTYGCLEKFARKPSLSNLISLRFLIKRAEQRISWDVGLRVTPNVTAERLLRLRMGAQSTGTESKARAPTIKEIAEMPADKQLDYYLACCRDGGMKIDPAALMKPGQTS